MADCLGCRRHPRWFLFGLPPLFSPPAPGTRRIARARRGEAIRATFSRETWTSKMAAPAAPLQSLRGHRPPCTGTFYPFAKSGKRRSRKQSRSRQEGDGSLDLDEEKRSRYLRAHRSEFENPPPAAPLQSLLGRAARRTPWHSATSRLRGISRD